MKDKKSIKSQRIFRMNTHVFSWISKLSNYKRIKTFNWILNDEEEEFIKNNEYKKDRHETK